MANPEYEAMVQCTEILVTSIAMDPEAIARALFAQNLISEDVEAKMALPITPTSKASKLVECACNQVSNFPKEVYPKILEVLKKYGWLEKAMQTLEDKLSMFNHKNYVFPDAVMQV